MVAPGILAPGHLGELTRIVPFELVDSLIDEARVREQRVRTAVAEMQRLVNELDRPTEGEKPK